MRGMTAQVFLAAFRDFFQNDEDPELSRKPRRPSIPFVVYVAALLWLGIIGAFVLMEPFMTVNATIHDGVFEETTFRLTEDAKTGMYGTFGFARIEDGPLEGKHFKFFADFNNGEEYVMRANEVYRATLSFSDAKPEALTKNIRRGCSGQAKITRVVRCSDTGVLGAVAQFRREAIEDVMRVSPSDSMGQALLLALVFGDRNHLETQGLYDAIKVLGLAHLVAVSGAHLSIVTATMSSLMSRLHMCRRFIVVVLCIGMAVYVLLTGCGPSVIRAAVMATVGLSSEFVRRRSNAFSALAVCTCIMLAFNPMNAFSLSFALSVLSTLGIIVFTPLFSFWITQFTGRKWAMVRDVIAMTVAAQLTTAPIVLPLFGRMIFLGVAANIFAAAFLALYLPASVIMVFIGVFVDPLLHVCCFLPTSCAQVFCEVCMRFSGVPGMSFPVNIPVAFATIISIVMAVLLWVCWPSVKREVLGLGILVLVVLLLLLITPRFFQSSKIITLDVGQGDAILVQSRGQNFLIDTGRVDTLLLQGLSRYGVTHLDGCLITHHDADHYGALSSLRGTVSIDTVYVAQDALECDCASCMTMFEEVLFSSPRNVRGVEVGDVVKVGAFHVRVVWPHAYEDEGGNDDSICLLALFDGDRDGVSDVTTFLPGDAEHKVVQALIDEGVLGDIDIYKIGHHGSKDALTDEQAQILLPEVSIVSAGAGNRYGHPAFETLEVLKRVQSNIMRTDVSGDITCVMHADSYTVKT